MARDYTIDIGPGKVHPRTQARIERTQKLLVYYRDNPDEYSMLKGVLCMSHAFNVRDDAHYTVEDLFVSKMIATRMDEIRQG